ncbi:MAG: hypothetical protein Q9222_006322 [Ikaeria aurantiellina]
MSRLTSSTPTGPGVDSKQSAAYIGQTALKDTKFCPLAAVSKWPYKFFVHQDSETISKAFFAAGKFRMRGWTLYYIHTLLSSSNKPLILVPATEVQALFDDIKEKLRLVVYFPKPEREPGFLLSFDEPGIPQPQYLGRLDLQHSLDDMEALIPPYKPVDHDAQRSDDRSFAAFKEKMEDAVEATRQKSKHQRDKKKKERIGAKQGWCEQLKRTQCYLGIRPRAEPGLSDPLQDPSIPQRELERALRRYHISQCLDLPSLVLSDAAPFRFQDDAVFICVDVEAYEKEHRPITEIGISTLDTKDLAALPPGEGGCAWMKKIRSRHFRIKEAAHLHNSEFVAGCADRFEFGESEWISIKEAPQVIASCFRPPYSGQADDNAENGSLLNGDATSSPPKRNLILVGHDIKMDIDYLRKIGYDVSNLSNIIEALDTVDLYRAWKHHQNPSKLGTILCDLELVGWNLHNAGNDAAYTLQALIGIAIAARTSASLSTNSTSSYITSRTQDLEREARDRAKEEAAEWAAADVEGGDGGPPQPLERFGWPTEEGDGVMAKSNGMGKVNVKNFAGKEKVEERRKVEEKRKKEAKDMEVIMTSRGERLTVKKIEPVRKEEIVSEPWVEEEEQVAVGNGNGNGLKKEVKVDEEGAGVEDAAPKPEEDAKSEVQSFDDGITSRLALLEEKKGDDDGGVKLPKELIAA